MQLNTCQLPSRIWTLLCSRTVNGNSGLLHKALPKLGYSKTISVSSHFSWLSGSQRNCHLCYKFPGVFFLPVLCMFIYAYELFFPPPSSLMKDFEVNTFNHLSVYVVGAVGWLFDLWCNDQWSREVICCKMSANQLLLLFFITKFVIVMVKLRFYKIFISLWFCETHTCCLLTDHF